MSARLIVASLFCFFSSLAFALSPYAIVYGNGVNNSDQDMRAARMALGKQYGNKAPDGQGILYFGAIASSTSLLCDLTESYLQKRQSTDSWRELWKAQNGFDPDATLTSPALLEAFDLALAQCAKSAKQQLSATNYTDADLEAQLSLYRTILDSGRQVLIVAHSQGNFYANLAFRRIKQERPDAAIAIVGVASPANEVADARALDIYETARSDIVIGAVEAIDSSTLNPTFHFPSEPTGLDLRATGLFNAANSGDFFGHNFVQAYINPDLISWEQIKKQIDRGLQFLASVQLNQSPVASFSASALTVAVGQQITFDPRASRDPDGQVVSYAWDFGDGTGLSAPRPDLQPHIYTTPGPKTVRLTVSDDRGGTNSTELAIAVTIVQGNRPPIASFTANPSVVKVSGIVYLDASASRDPDGSIATYAWDFGDGQTANLNTPQYSTAYSSPGIYPARLMVTDNEGATTTTTRDIRVTETDPGVVLYENLAIGGGCMQFLPQGDKSIVTARLWSPSVSDFSHVLMRVSATGGIDTTFGNNGTVSFSNLTPGFESIDGNSELCLGAVDNLGRIVLSSSTLRSVGDVSVRAHVIRLTENGALDTSFADHGIFRFDNARYDQVATTTNRIAVDAFNRIIVAGQSARLTCPFSTCFWEGLAFRINADGALDDSFNGGAGVLTWTDPVVGFQPFVHSYFSGVAVDPLGRILLGGCTSYCANYQGEAYAVRLTPSGVLDTSFGDGGNRLLPLYSAADPNNVTSMPGIRTIQNFSIGPDDRILATGWNYYSNMASTIYRLLPDGALDPTFTYGGVLTDFGWLRPFMASAPVGQFLRDGKITLVGATYVSYYDDYLAVGRLNADGTPDISFNQADLVYPSTPAQRTWSLTLRIGLCNEAPGGSFMQPDGRIIVAGTYACGYPYTRGGIYLMRVNTDGTIDPTFGQ